VCFAFRFRLDETFWSHQSSLLTVESPTTASAFRASALMRPSVHQSSFSRSQSRFFSVLRFVVLGLCPLASADLGFHDAALSEGSSARREALLLRPCRSAAGSPLLAISMCSFSSCGQPGLVGRGQCAR
jgi:hypothetical protein